MLRVRSVHRLTGYDGIDSRVVDRFVPIRSRNSQYSDSDADPPDRFPTSRASATSSSTSRACACTSPSPGPTDAEPLVLLHGWPQHWYAWRRLIGPLSERYRVICPDLRGFGWTDAPAGSYEKSELAADVIALLDVLGLERVRLAGHDWGGFVGFLVCIDGPRAGLPLRRGRDEPPLGQAGAGDRSRR